MDDNHARPHQTARWSGVSVMKVPYPPFFFFVSQTSHGSYTYGHRTEQIPFITNPLLL
jgi:hypothetical protein